MMKWPWPLLCLLFSFSIFASNKIEFFYSNDCIKCDHARAVLVAYKGKNPELEMIGINVYESKENLNRLRFLGLKENFSALDIPAFYYHSHLKVGLNDPGELLKWLDETHTKYQDLSYDKKSPAELSVRFAFKDFFISVWGVILILASVFITLKMKKLEGIISALTLSGGAIVSSILWTYPNTRIWFAQVMMVDVLIVGLLLGVSIFKILSSRKFIFSLWSELILFSVGHIVQRLCSIFGLFNFLKLQDLLLDSGISNSQQQGMNILYCLSQSMLMIVIILIISTLRKSSSVAKIS